ncbi:MAG: PilZ domain-containing protein [Acidobacteria bacterium]|nr:PilZ domain-containing protein [Acidobacteriota bacterium]
MPKKKAEAKKVEDLRAEERFPERIPVSLRVQSDDGEVEHGGTTIDISIFGLQVETHGKLEPGQLVNVPKFGDCIVVWVRNLGPGKPCQAGLKMVK